PAVASAAPWHGPTTSRSSSSEATAPTSTVTRGRGTDRPGSSTDLTRRRPPPRIAPPPWEKAVATKPTSEYKARWLKSLRLHGKGVRDGGREDCQQDQPSAPDQAPGGGDRGCLARTGRHQLRLAGRSGGVPSLHRGRLWVQLVLRWNAVSVRHVRAIWGCIL